MEVFVRATTPRGVFVGRASPSSSEEVVELEKLIAQLVSGNGAYLTLKTETGLVIFATETIKHSVFEIVIKES